MRILLLLPLLLSGCSMTVGVSVENRHTYQDNKLAEKLSLEFKHNFEQPKRN